MSIRKKAQRKIRREYLRFKRTLLVRHTKEEIFEFCGKIQFYTCMANYFEQKEEIPEAYLSLAIKEPWMIQAAWLFYLRNDDLRCQTWADLDGLLEEMLLSWHLPQAA